MNHIKNGVFLCATSKKLNKHLIKDIKGKQERERAGEREKGAKEIGKKSIYFLWAQPGRQKIKSRISHLINFVRLSKRRMALAP